MGVRIPPIGDFHPDSTTRRCRGIAPRVGVGSERGWTSARQAKPEADVHGDCGPAAPATAGTSGPCTNNAVMKRQAEPAHHVASESPGSGVAMSAQSTASEGPTPSASQEFRLVNRQPEGQAVQVGRSLAERAPQQVAACTVVLMSELLGKAGGRRSEPLPRLRPSACALRLLAHAEAPSSQLAASVQTQEITSLPAPLTETAVALLVTFTAAALVVSAAVHTGVDV